jgi:hypothetical protein
MTNNISCDNSAIMEQPPPLMDYREYVRNNNRILHFKWHELQSICRHYGLHVSGTKAVLRARLYNYFTRISHAVRIQRHWRKHIVMTWRKLSGAFRPPPYVNDTDFYSLDPIDSLPIFRRFAFQDAQQFVYRFDIESLMTMFKSDRKITNPYNRQDMGEITTCQFFRVYLLVLIIFKGVHAVRRDDEDYIMDIVDDDDDVVEDDYLFPVVPTAYRYAVVYQRIVSVNQRLYQRTHEVFMEIDRLGNYSQSRWFERLNYFQLATFYQMYSRYWNTNLTQQIRQNISPRRPNPFLCDDLTTYTIPMDLWCASCVDIMECMVYSGIDDDHRKLGALHVLFILTQVSHDAHLALPFFS